jgi:hypothetical protein
MELNVVNCVGGPNRPLLLGAAYGFINEGVVAGTWYVVHPPGYSFIGEIDWTWAVSLTLFHAIFIVFIPIAFIEILFPSLCGQSLLGRRGMVSAVVLLIGCIVIALIILAPLPSHIFLYRLAVLALDLGFSLLALALPSGQTAQAASTTSTLPLYHGAPGASVVSPTARGLPGLWQLRIARKPAMVSYFFLAWVFPVLVAAWP